MKRDIALIAILVCLPIHAAVSDDLTVLPDSIDGVPPHALLHQYLLGQATKQWDARREAVEE